MEWRGPCKLIPVDTETVLVQLNRDQRSYSSHFVKPWIQSELEEHSTNTTYHLRSVKLEVTKQHDVMKSRETEIQGLIDYKMFKQSDEKKIDRSCCVFGSKFVE